MEFNPDAPIPYAGVGPQFQINTDADYVPTDEEKMGQLVTALAVIYLDPEIGDRAREITKYLTTQ